MYSPLADYRLISKQKTAHKERFFYFNIRPQPNSQYPSSVSTTTASTGRRTR